MSETFAATAGISDRISDERQRRPFYGWVMLPIATAGFIATSPAQTFGVAAFNPSLREALGLSHGQLAGAYMLGTLLASLPMSYVGAAADRYGPRAVMTLVVALFGAACIATSQVRGLYTLFLAFLLLRLLGQGALGLLSGNTLAYWFERRLGMVEGVRHFCMAGAIAGMPALNLWLIGALGWRWAWAILGCGVWALMLPLMIPFRNRPEDVGQRKDGESADARDGLTGAQFACLTFAQTVRTRAFWIVVSAVALWGMMNTGVLFNILPILATRGLEPGHATTLFSAFAISLAIAHLAGGYLADRVPLHLLLAGAVGMMTITMGCMAAVERTAGVVMTGLSMGVAQGLVTAAGSPLWARYYGRTHLGRIRGVIATAIVASSSAGPFLVGLLRDLTGGYTASLLLFTLLPVPLVGLSFLATPPYRKRCGRKDDPTVALAVEDATL